MIAGLALSPSLDVTYLVDDFRLGGISIPTEVVPSAGGKTLNAARVAAQLGSDVAVVAALGGYTGARVGSLLAGSGVRVTTVDAGAETRTCVSVASGTSAGLTELYQPAEPLTDAAWQECRDALAALALAEGDWLLLAGSVPAGVPLAEFALALRAHRDRGIRVAIDTHGVALAALVGEADLVKVNRSEAVALLDIDPDLALHDVAARLHEASRTIVVVTDGVHGSYAAGDGIALRVDPDPVTGAFPVGSGDSYFGGLVHALDSGATLADALLIAASCASANAMRAGAAVLEPADVEAARGRIVVSAS